MKKYKITIWKVIKPNLGILLLLFLLLVYEIVSLSNVRFLIIIVVLVGLLPNIILSLNYYIEDRKKVLTLDIDNRIVKISEPRLKEKGFTFEEIVTISRIGVKHSKVDLHIPTTSWRLFYYYEIRLKDKSSILVTRFLIERIERLVAGTQTDYVKQWYPWIGPLNHRTGL